MSDFRSTRIIVSLAAAGVALLSLVYGDFAPGGELLPDWTPYRSALTTLIALLLMAASIGLQWRRTGTISSCVMGGYYGIWVLISVPIALSNPFTIGAWYPICEGLTAFVAPCIVYCMCRPSSDSRTPSMVIERAVRAAQMVFALTCIFYGASHFAYADYTASMVPTWIPGALAMAYVTGFAHIAAGIGILFGIFARPAALLETAMMTLFGVLVWLPTFFMQQPPKWATPPHNQWSEVAANLVLVASAWAVATSLNPNFRRRVRESI